MQGDTTDHEEREPGKLNSSGIFRILGSARERFAGLLYPPTCAACSGATSTAPGLCAGCWAAMPFISEPVCQRFGTPFLVRFGDAMLSPAAIADPPRFDRGRAVALHKGIAQTLVSRFKYSDRLDLAPFMASLMAQAGRALIAETDIILPVPIYPVRLWQRRYNQAALLANHIGAGENKPVRHDLLKRVRATIPQVGLSRQQRRANLAGAFGLAQNASVEISGRSVLLIDDVRTTGSTLNACAAILNRAGARRVDALTFTLVKPDH